MKTELPAIVAVDDVEGKSRVSPSMYWSATVKRSEVVVVEPYLPLTARKDVDKEKMSRITNADC